MSAHTSSVIEVLNPVADVVNIAAIDKIMAGICAETSRHPDIEFVDPVIDEAIISAFDAEMDSRHRDINGYVIVPHNGPDDDYTPPPTVAKKVANAVGDTAITVGDAAVTVVTISGAFGRKVIRKTAIGVIKAFLQIGEYGLGISLLRSS
jgi:hypothetical protein